MSSVNKLYEEIVLIIEKDNFKTEELVDALVGISSYINNVYFLNNIRQVVDIIIKDRDGNNKFDEKDLKMISKNTLTIISLVSSILLLLSSISKQTIELNEDALEELIFKLLVYIFLVIVPRETSSEWTAEERMSVLQLVLLIHEMINATQLIKMLKTKISSWFAQKKWCKCMSAKNDGQNIVEKRMPEIHEQLKFSINNIRYQ